MLFLQTSNNVGGEWGVARDVMGKSDELAKRRQAGAVVNAQMNATGVACGDNCSENFGTGAAAALPQNGSRNCGSTAIMVCFAELVGALIWVALVVVIVVLSIIVLASIVLFKFTLYLWLNLVWFVLVCIERTGTVIR